VNAAGLTLGGRVTSCQTILLPTHLLEPGAKPLAVFENGAVFEEWGIGSIIEEAEGDAFYGC
jgi:hypothetical protein